MGLLSYIFGKKKKPAAGPEQEELLLTDVVQPGEQDAAPLPEVVLNKDYAIFQTDQFVMAGFPASVDYAPAYEYVPRFAPNGKPLFKDEDGRLIFPFDEKKVEGEAPQLRFAPLVTPDGKQLFDNPGGEPITRDDLPPPEDGKPLKGVTPAVQKTKGIAFNTTTLAGYIKAMERGNYDMSREKAILAALETFTANAGLTEAMAKVRMTGVTIGELGTEKYQLMQKATVPVDTSGLAMQIYVPQL